MSNTLQRRAQADDLFDLLIGGALIFVGIFLFSFFAPQLRAYYTLAEIDIQAFVREQYVTFLQQEVAYNGRQLKLWEVLSLPEFSFADSGQEDVRALVGEDEVGYFGEALDSVARSGPLNYSVTASGGRDFFRFFARRGDDPYELMLFSTRNRLDFCIKREVSFISSESGIGNPVPAGKIETYNLTMLDYDGRPLTFFYQICSAAYEKQGERLK